MSNFSSSRKSTRKARRKDDGARVTAHALSQGRSPKGQGRRPGADPDADAENTVTTTAAAQVPTIADERPSGAYVQKEHVRRDVGSHVLVLDLTAEDAPDDAPLPFTDPDGVEQRFAAQCITHDKIAFFPNARGATEAAKASHLWCDGCTELVTNTPKIQSKARARKRTSDPTTESREAHR